MLLRAHYRTWQAQKQDSKLDDLDRRHYYARYRRRMQTSGMLALLGLLLPIGDAFIPADAPGVFGIYWIAVLLLTFWVVLLGLGDMVSTTAYSKASMARIRRK